jgi:hypothetical protein
MCVNTDTDRNTTTNRATTESRNEDNKNKIFVGITGKGAPCKFCVGLKKPCNKNHKLYAYVDDGNDNDGPFEVAITNEGKQCKICLRNFGRDQCQHHRHHKKGRQYVTVCLSLPSKPSLLGEENSASSSSEKRKKEKMADENDGSNKDSSSDKSKTKCTDDADEKVPPVIPPSPPAAAEASTTADGCTQQQQQLEEDDEAESFLKVYPPASMKGFMIELGMLDKDGMISSDYSRETAKKAYHKMSMKHHPDKNPLKKDAATEKFQTISSSWSELDELLENNDEEN